ncbi:MAG: hypothetical protein II984_04745 [Clostridia bacterium]|nr:hypothetical protein [Clostridia bacterium]
MKSLRDENFSEGQSAGMLPARIFEIKFIIKNLRVKITEATIKKQG